MFHDSQSAARLRQRSVVAVCVGLLFAATALHAQNPPQNGLRLWLDASDIDANPSTGNPPPGTPISSWAAKKGDVVAVQATASLQPTMDQLGFSAAIDFGDDFLLDPDLTGDSVQNVSGDQSGAIVTIFSRTQNQEGFLMFLGTQLATVTFPQQSVGFGFSTPQEYASGLGSTNDGQLHYSVVNSNGLAWEFYIDGLQTTIDMIHGANTGRWFGDFSNPSLLGLGQFTFSDGEPDNCCPFHGYIAEILVYSHPLNPNQRDDLADYVDANTAHRSRYPVHRPVSRRRREPVDINLDWDDNPIEDAIFGYDVLRAETTGGPYSKINDSFLPTSDYVDATALPGTVYYYVVTATNINGEGLPSTEASAALYQACDLATPAAPNVSGLRFWLDASDIGVGPGTLVLSWTDKKCGTTFVPSDSLRRPTMGTLGSTNAPAVLFDDDYLIALDVGLEWFQDLQGSVVTVFSRTGDTEGHLLSVGGGGDSLATANFQGLGAGFAVATQADFVLDPTVTNNGGAHYSIVTTDSTAWQLFNNGTLVTPVIQDGTNSGDWWGSLAPPTFVGIGQFADVNTGVPPDICCPYFGHIAEVLIYDHALTTTDRDTIDAYLTAKYGCFPAEPSEVTCNDGEDNDCDGDIDGDDLDCCVVTETPETTCDDGIDNDCDGDVDDADVDCQCVPTETPDELTCDDLIDNDCDGDVDDADTDCQCNPTETPETTCDDGIDNDWDGNVDDADTDCPSCVPSEKDEVTCNDGIDNDCNGAIDADDLNCDCVRIEGVATCDDGLDNDCDGDIDSEDQDCQCMATETNEVSCGDAFDNDCDGDIDTADSDCLMGQVGPFLRGDCDGHVGGGPTDPVLLLDYAFRGGRTPPCLAACDAEANGSLNVTDALRNLQHSFLGIGQPDGPFPDCTETTQESDLELGFELPSCEF